MRVAHDPNFPDSIMRTATDQDHLLRTAQTHAPHARVLTGSSPQPPAAKNFTSHINHEHRRCGVLPGGATPRAAAGRAAATPQPRPITHGAHQRCPSNCNSIHPPCSLRAILCGGCGHRSRNPCGGTGAPQLSVSSPTHPGLIPDGPVLPHGILCSAQSTATLCAGEHPSCCSWSRI